MSPEMPIPSTEATNLNVHADKEQHVPVRSKLAFLNDVANNLAHQKKVQKKRDAARRAAKRARRKNRR